MHVELFLEILWVGLKYFLKWVGGAWKRAIWKILALFRRLKEIRVSKATRFSGMPGALRRIKRAYIKKIVWTKRFSTFLNSNKAFGFVYSKRSSTFCATNGASHLFVITLICVKTDQAHACVCLWIFTPILVCTQIGALELVHQLKHQLRWCLCWCKPFSCTSNACAPKGCTPIGVQFHVHKRDISRLCTYLWTIHVRRTLFGHTSCTSMSICDANARAKYSHEHQRCSCNCMSECSCSHELCSCSRMSFTHAWAWASQMLT